MANTTNTGISISSTDQLSAGQKILVASALMAFEPAAPDPDLVANERIPQGHKQWDILTFARLALASALTEGVDLTTVQQLFANSLSITPTEHGIIGTVSNELIRRQGDSSVMGTTGTLLGGSLRRRQSRDIIALYDGFSKSVGGATTTLDVTHFRGSVAYLLTDNDSEFGPAELPIHAALHIEHISDIVLDISDPGTRTQAEASARVGLSADLLQRWWRGNDRLYGIQIFHSGNIPRNTNAAKGAIFNPTALHLVMATDAEATEEIDNSLRARELGIFQTWGEAERADPYGVEMFFDAATTV